MPPSELARQIRTSVDDAEYLLETLERLGYVRRLAVTRVGRHGDHEWLLMCDESEATLKAAYEHLALDPGNSLINGDALGLRAMRARWFRSDWLNAPLATELADSPDLAAKGESVPSRSANT